MANTSLNTGSNPNISATPAPAVPLLHELRLSKDAEDWLKTISPSTFQSYDSIQQIWNLPTTQFGLTLVQDHEFKGAIEQMAAQHAGSTFLSYELVLILIFWIIRAWRLGKVSTWLLRIWTQAWIGFIFWLLSVFLVPYLVWGESYTIVLRQLFKAILRHYFA